MTKIITVKLIQDILLNGFTPVSFVDEETSRRLWWSALEVIQKEFLVNHYHHGGLWVAAPLPVINEKKYLNRLKGWLWAPEGFPFTDNDRVKYLPQQQSRGQINNLKYTNNYKILNLHSKEGFKPFLMIITPNFQCVLTVIGEQNQKNLIMRSDQETLKKVIELVGMKLKQSDLGESKYFHEYLQRLGRLNVNDEFTKSFWPNVSIKLANLMPSLNLQASINEYSKKSLQNTEAKLLEALSHEVRTPLTTIRTLISSTLSKYKMEDVIRNRLIQIKNECNEQIDRFGLIFNAAELVNDESSNIQQLASINLGEILHNLSPNWSSQLERRGISLKIDIPNELPKILSNSEKLELMLSGLIDKNTRGVKAGSTLILELRLAGQKLKLQLFVQKEDFDNTSNNPKYIGSDIGPVLNWNPQTGSLQISQSATHKLITSLGGHVTQRRDTGLTVFFPISDIT